MEVFFQHFLHVIAGGAIVAGMLFGLIALLLFIDKRKSKRSGMKPKAPREEFSNSASYSGRSKRRTKKGRRP